MARENLIYNQQYILEKLMELAYDGIVVVDAEGIIILISKVYTDFLGISEKDAVGRVVNDVIENTRLPEVLKSGKAETARLQRIKGSYMIASRFPMIRDGKVIGAIGKVLFKNIDELNVLHRRIANLQQQLKDYRNHPGGRVKYSFGSIIGESDKLLLAKVMGENAGMTDSSVLLLGESGTGKELFAHAIHQSSPRSGNAFIKVNCAAIPSELLESELFGYEEGAFTGARKGGKAGRFELADGGTLFLDEIGDMPAGMQAKLLRVLQEHEIEKVGAKYPLKVDVRIIAATNQNLENLVADGRFRADLFYRLNVVAIKIPPLRERPEDINQLAPYLLNKICDRLGKYVDEVSAQAMSLLKHHRWPGNVRELENALERAVNLIGCEGIIMPEHLPQEIGGGNSGGAEKLARAVENAERRAIEQALRLARGKKAGAARLLGISRSGLYKLIDKLKM